MAKQPAPKDDATRRRGARRTAWVVGALALGVYLAFMLSAMIP